MKIGYYYLGKQPDRQEHFIDRYFETIETVNSSYYYSEYNTGQINGLEENGPYPFIKKCDMVVIDDNLSNRDSQIDQTFEFFRQIHKALDKPIVYFYHDLAYNEVLRKPSEYRICCDVDGVLANTSSKKDYENSEPIIENIHLLNDLYWSGAHITLHTARYMLRENHNAKLAHDRGYEELRKWCKKHFVYYDNIVMGKPSAQYYIDDKAIQIGELKSTNWKSNNYLDTVSKWKEIAEQLDNYKNANL